MPEYLAPGVHIEEFATGPRSIEGVSTSTTGFVGQTERGPMRPRLVTSWRDFQSWFGGIVDADVSYLPFAARGFFDNGGQRLFIARVTRDDARTSSLMLATSDPEQQLVISAAGPGAFGDRVFVRIQAGTLTGIRLTLSYHRAVPTTFADRPDIAAVADPDGRGPDTIEDYDNLGVQPNDADYFLQRINASSRLVTLSWSIPTSKPARPNDVVYMPLAGGADGSNPMTAARFRGDTNASPDRLEGLAGLGTIDEISILSIPDEVNAALLPNVADHVVIRNAMIDQCESLRNRISILNVPGGSSDVALIHPPRDSSYAAIYYPWIRVIDPRTSETGLVPPSGHVAGIYARTDTARGVHKAPANEVLSGVVTDDMDPASNPLEFAITEHEQEILNSRGVNVIRDFRAVGRGIRVWGARTISSDPEWRYVNVRRLLLFIEESIDKGTQWTVFEPNDGRLWASVRRSISSFLLLIWRSGALQGDVTEAAFFVKCDKTTMTQADINAGRLICTIGVAPAKPAEFVIFRIQQKAVEPEST